MPARTPIIAIAAASTAVLLSLIALIVVASRAPKGSDAGLVPFETAVVATDVVKLRDNIELATDSTGALGVRVVDERIRLALGLKVGDVIASLSGRSIKKETDIAEALVGIRYLETMMVYVDVIRDGEPVVLRWKLDDKIKNARADRPRLPDPVQPVDPFATQLGGTADPMVDQITKIDDYHYAIPRTVVDQALANPMAMARGARIVPAMSMGKTEGFKLYAIRPSSLYAKLGLSNGDLIRAINGFSLDGPDRVLEIYTKLRDATSLEIELTRRGRDESLFIEIR